MGNDSLTGNLSVRTKDNNFKLKERRFRLYIRMKFFDPMLGRWWDRMPGEALDALTPETF